MSNDITPGAGRVEGTAEAHGPPAERDLSAVIIPAVLVAIGGLLIYGTATMTEAGDGGLFGAKTFPRIVAGLCFVVALAMVADIVRPRRLLVVEDEPREASNWPALLTVFGGLLFFILTLEWLGWLIAATILFAAVAIGLGNRRYLSCLLGGLVLASVIQITFSGILEISLPSGLLGRF
ncbi:tripartite tricarboxylate transporter TctB family protein [Ornithinimicrobium pratense]|uniref:Tripartite tricarboxylate transporter TctB family protein n=1 Tax=Ornithinimicrobium pratense TaxID=2593973 RepID=A0A5J6V593_9MICO|nr:tripartite tricarboxylate transporter TctB family protein [Ornithinimicrobium pratense]QFG68183.1 tripartite tricarboxylate transporter TctB family protein [Ornithinimicrobium pratense]